MENFLTVFIFLIRQQVEEFQASRHFKDRRNEDIYIYDHDDDLYVALPGTVPESVLNDPFLLLRWENDYFAKELPAFTEQWFQETRAVYIERQKNAENSCYKDLDRKQNWAYEELVNGDAFEILRSSTEGTFLVSRNQEKHDEIKKNASRVATIYYVSSSGAIRSKSIYCQQNMNFVIYSVRETNFWFRSITSLMKHIVREKVLLSDTLLTKAFEKTYI